MKKSPLIALFILILCACGAPTESVESEAVITTKEKKKEKRHKIEPIYADPVGNYAEVLNDSNYIQYEVAERIGIDPIETIDLAYHTKRPLVKIGTCDNYRLDNLTHSMPFLVPEAAEVLDEIGKAFGDSIEKRGGDRRQRFIVTSVLRSPYTVRLLQKVNINAVDSSTHKFATTFDIAYNNFDYTQSVNGMPPERLKEILARVLLNKRNEGKCLVKYEVKSPCFHITATK